VGASQGTRPWPDPINAACINYCKKKMEHWVRGAPPLMGDLASDPAAPCDAAPQRLVTACRHEQERGGGRGGTYEGWASTNGRASPSGRPGFASPYAESGSIPAEAADWS
jgi:hypothetical protein